MVSESNAPRITTGKITIGNVVHPAHYNVHPSGVECIEIVEWFCFNLGNTIKYVWRADEKDDDIEDLEKAKFYIEREIERRKRIRATRAAP